MSLLRMHTLGPCAHLPVGLQEGPGNMTRVGCSVAQRRAAATEPSVFAELQDAVAEVMPTLQEQGISVYLLSDACTVPGIDALSGEISRASDEPLSRSLRANVHIRSTALYIYTSGTTGTEETLPCEDCPLKLMNSLKLTLEECSMLLQTWL